MKITLLACGRLKDATEQAHLQRYTRLFDAAARGLRLPPLEIAEFPESRAQTAALRKAEEARAFAERVPPGGVLLALDEGGELVTSAGLAALLQNHRDRGAPVVVFAIGGPDGHGAALLAEAEARLSLGRITLPHGLARIVLAEQLYRALTILAGHPYHRA